MLPKAFKSYRKSNKSPNLVSLLVAHVTKFFGHNVKAFSIVTLTRIKHDLRYVIALAITFIGHMTLLGDTVAPSATGHIFNHLIPT